MSRLSNLNLNSNARPRRTFRQWLTFCVLGSLLACAFTDLQVASADEKKPDTLSKVEERFIREMHVHRARMRQYATYLYGRFPTHFAPVTLELLLEYLELHDLPKVEKGLKPGENAQSAVPVAERLARYYGRNRSSLSEQEKRDLDETVESLNSTEKSIKEKFIRKHNLSKEQVAKLEWLERILDVTDTGMHRKEEMGLTDAPYDGRDFLLRRYHDHVGALISQWLESHFGPDSLAADPCDEMLHTSQASPAVAH